MAGDRFCPLCDDYLADDVCPSHGVPTIAKFDSSEALVKLEVGTTIAGRYRVERFLRQGGMGVVLLARQLESDQKVVVKVLKNDRLALRNNLRRFYQEARVISRLSHPNIVRIFEFGFDPPTRVPFLAMELIEGRTIREIVKGDGPFAEDRTAALLAGVARALIEAHDKGVLHRDLKPANLMVVRTAGDDEEIKVLDFGLAKVLEPEEGTKPFTAPGQAVGTPAFMAPEQITQSPQDFRTDLYGLGCVMHVMLTGTPPFDGPDRLEVMRKQIREPPPPLPDRLADGRSPSAELIALHKKLLMKNRPDRPASATDVVAILDRLAHKSDAGSPDMMKTETVLAIDLSKVSPSIKVQIPEAATVREEIEHSVEPNTQPEVESFKSSSSSQSSHEGSDSSTRLVHRSFGEALRTLHDPSEKPSQKPSQKGAGFADEDELWTSVLPSSMQSEPEGLTPVIDADSEPGTPELAVHDRRRLERSQGNTPTPLTAVPGVAAVTATQLTPPIPAAAQTMSRAMPSVGAIVELPAKPKSASLEKKVLIAVGIVSIIAILLSVFALISRGSPEGSGTNTSGTNTPTGEKR